MVIPYTTLFCVYPQGADQRPAAYLLHTVHAHHYLPRDDDGLCIPEEMVERTHFLTYDVRNYPGDRNRSRRHNNIPTVLYRRNIELRIRYHPRPIRRSCDIDHQDDGGNWSDDVGLHEVELDVEELRVETSEVLFHLYYRRTFEVTSDEGVADVFEVEGVF